MIFALFAVLIAFVFFACSLFLLNYGRHAADPLDRDASAVGPAIAAFDVGVKSAG